MVLFTGGEFFAGEKEKFFPQDPQKPFPFVERDRTITLPRVQKFEPTWINTEGLEPAVYDDSHYSIGKRSQFFVLRRTDFVASESVEEPEAQEEVRVVVPQGQPAWLTSYIRNEKLQTGFDQPSGAVNLDNAVALPPTLSSNDSLFIGNKIDSFSDEVPVEPEEPQAPEEDGIPNEWKFTIAPASISWSKSGAVNRDNPFGVNKQLIYYTSTSMRSLSLGECYLEGFSLGLSVEDKIRSLERCMEIVRKPEGFLTPYVWEFFGIGKSYGFYIISNVSINEIMRDDRGSATKAVVSIELQEVPEFQIYNGRDLARSGDLVKPNFQKDICGSTNGSAVGGIQSENESQFFSEVSQNTNQPPFKGSLELSKKYESYEGEAYDLEGEGIYTIGYGLRGFYYDEAGNQVPITASSTMTEAEATATKNRRFAIEFLPELQKIPGWNDMSSGQQSALASFSWNLGAGFYESPGFETISGALREKRWNDVPSALLLYRNPGSKFEEGLRRRRIEEGQLWSNSL